MSVPVVLAAPGLAGETDLVAALARPGAQVSVVRRCVDAIDLVGAAASGCAHAAVVGPHLPRLARDTIARLAAARVGVLGVVAAGDDAGERMLRDLDVSEVVVFAPGDIDQAISQLTRAIRDSEAASTESIDAIDLKDDVAGATSTRDPGADGQLGSLITVWGAHGAPGATSVAIALSDELARMGQQSLLVDADTMGGSTAMALGVLDEASGLAVACRHADAGTLDAFTFAQAARSLGEGWRILTGITRAERWVELRPAALSRLWQVCRDLPGIAIADIGSGLEPPESGWGGGSGDRFAAAHTAIEHADAIIAVGSADPVGMDRLISGLEVLRQRTDVPPVVVVNRLRRSVLGRDAAGQIREALARHAQITDPILIDDDPSAFDAALKEGRTLAEVAARSKVRGQLRDLAHRVAREPVAGEPVAVPAP
jgi:MinD-like ATPase involved in chromosome partitioning or flagellar assembly